MSEVIYSVYGLDRATFYLQILMNASETTLASHCKRLSQLGSIAKCLSLFTEVSNWFVLEKVRQPLIFYIISHV